MPFLPINPLQGYSLNRIAVLGVMYFPNDQRKRKEFIQTHLVDVHLKDNTKIMDKVTPNFIEEILHAPSIDTIQNNMVKSYARAYQAGLVVIYLYLLQQLKKSPSMNRALRLVENRYSNILAKQHKMRPIAHSEESIRKNWKIFKSVSHLWGAHIAFNEEETIESSHDFELFLARSEFFLSFCLGIFPEKVKKPLFNKDEMWLSPAGYPLPVIEPIDILEIDEQIRNEIETYSVGGIIP
jgi:hypothetical protein